MPHSAVHQLLAHAEADDPFDYRAEEVRTLQLQAADERLRSARASIPVLDQRARDVSVERIGALGDIVPLFFSDATYKSYPESFIAGGKWRALAAWLDTLSTRKGAAELDFDGVENIDGWLARLREAGHFLYASSGTSGRSSLFQVNDSDRLLDRRLFALCWRWATGVAPGARDRTVFALFPPGGSHRLVDTMGFQVEQFGREDSIFYLGTEPLRLSDVNALGRLRRDIAQGTAAPSEIQRFETEAAERQARMDQAIELMADQLVKHADEPALFIGFWVPMYQLLQAARARGWSGGVHPDSLVMFGGGLKGVSLPDGFQDEIASLLDLPASRSLTCYGMSELTSFLPRCPARRYHVPPWMIPLVLDQTGERLEEITDGRVEGRVAFFDLSLEARWGALITGDKGTLTVRPCGCGRPSPAFEDSITRYIDLPGGDDKVTCTGTIDAYVRGELGAA